MNKGIAQELKSFAETIASRYSNTSRECNHNNESFTVDEVIPTSDHSAVINFKKIQEKLQWLLPTTLLKVARRVGSIFSQPIPM